FVRHRAPPYRLSVFFFSSRRRHTRWPRDWSSDVCSSDLERLSAVRPTIALTSPRPGLRTIVSGHHDQRKGAWVFLRISYFGTTRSEERRVGKECRSRWRVEHYKKKRSRFMG